MSKRQNLHLFARENKSLLLWWNPFLFFDAFLDAVHLVRGLNIDFNFLASQSLQESVDYLSRFRGEIEHLYTNLYFDQHFEKFVRSLSI